MKRKLTFLISAAVMLLTMMATTGEMWGQSDYSTTYTSNCTLTAGTNGSTCSVSIGNNSYDGIKVGTSKAGGTMTVKVPSGAKYLHIHVAAWNGVTGLSLNITPNTNISPTSVSLTADSGISSNSPFTFAGTASSTDYYKVITFTNALTSETTFTFTTSTTKRFVIWGVNSEEEGGGGNTPSISADDVNIAYDATSGSIAYTLTNGNGNVTASVTNGDWLTLGTITESAVPFTCSANDGGERTATVTLSYTGATDKAVTVTQAGALSVAAPTFSPEAGTYTSAQNVTISTTTEGATIYYTTDGSTPTSGSTAYTSAISVATTQTIKAIAIKNEVSSAVSEAAYTINIPITGYVINFESDANLYADWTFTNMESKQTGNNNVTAHGGTYYGTTGGKATASIQTKEKYSNPGNLTCYVTKQSNNTTSSTWYIQVSSDGSTWTDVETQSATSMSAGTWVEFSADLSSYSNVYVRVYYSGSTAVRNIDDLSLTEASNTFSVTYDGNGNTGGSVPTDSNEYDDENNTVTVLGNTGNLVKAGYVWSGWNTQPNGEGTTYQANATFTITANTTLYAKWNAKTITNLSFTGTPTKTSYNSGESFDPTGLTVTATFNDESSENVTALVTWTPDPLTTGTTSVTGTYMGLTINVSGLTVTAAPGSEGNPYTVAQARAAIDAGTGLTDVYATGIVSGIVTAYNSQYGNISYNMSSDGLTTSDQLQAYRGKSYNGVDFTSADDIQVGDIVVVKGTLKKYNSTYEFDQNNQLVSLVRKVKTPTFSPVAGNVQANTEVTISCETQDATIHYTTNGDIPTAESTEYSSPISVTEDMTIKAIAVKDGMTNSDVASATYTVTVTPIAVAPTFSSAAGLIVAGTTVTMSTTTENATIYYTTDGSDPTTSSSSGTTVTINENCTLKAIAVANGYENSSVTSAAYIVVQHAGTEADPYNVADARIAIDANMGKTGVYATGIVSQIVTAYGYNNYQNITFNIVDEAGDENFLQAFRCVGDDAPNVLVNDNVVVYGDLTKYNSTYEFGQGCQVVSLEHPTVPAITAEDVNLTYDATSGSIAYTITNPVDGGALTAAITGGNEGDWLVLGAVGESSVALTCSANEGDEDRSATVTLTYTYNTNETVTKAITVTQAHFVVDYATLPFAFDGGKADMENTYGLSQEGLGSDYGSSPKLKFDNAGDWVVLKINERPGVLTFDIKGNSFSGSTFKVQTSEDGETYTDLVTYTELGSTQNESFDNLGSDVRYIKWIYTEKSSGNVALGNIALAAYQEPQEQVATPTFTPEAGEYNAAQNVTIACATNGATIHYTTNGDTPTAESTEYTAAIPVNTTTTIKAIAVKDGMNNSAVASATYTITAPVPAITASDVNLTYDATSGSIDYTITNPVDGGALTAAITDGNEGTWLALGAVGESSVSLTCSANEGNADRTATVTLTYTYNTNETVTKEVTVTQAHFVVDYATLPFNWDGGSSADFNALNGVTTSGLGSDYAASNAPYLIKLDGNGDFIQVKTNEQPGKVTIGVKMAGGPNTSKITVKASADGETFDDGEELTISGAQNDIVNLETTRSFNTDVRYVKMVFTKGSNVGVGPITIAQVDNTPSITAEDVNIAYDATGGSITYTINNPVEGGSMSSMPTSGGDWLTVGGPSNGNVALTCEQNTGAERTATVRLTYTYNNTKEAVTKDVTVTQSGVPATMYTVNFNLDGGTFMPNDDFTDEIVEIEAGTYHLPSATKEGFDFTGWSDGNTTYEADAEYTVSADVDFTAQWTESTTVTYELVTSNNDIVSGAYYYIAGVNNSDDWFAMGQQNSNNRQAVSVTVSNNTINQTDDVHEVVISIGNDGFFYSIFDEASGASNGYLYAAGGTSNNYLRTDPDNYDERGQWEISIDEETHVASITANITTRNIMRFNNNSSCFSCYSSGQLDIYLFKKVDNSPSISADDVNIAYDATSGSIIYEIENYEEGTMTAASEADWISNIAVEETDEMGEVTFNVTPNTSNVSRSATVTLTFTYDNDKTATANVTVTQNGQPGQPSITVDPESAVVVSDGGAPEFTINYASIAIEDEGDFDVQFYESNGTTTISKPDWINSATISGNTTDGFTLTVTVDPNTSAERAAYLKVYAFYGDDIIYSNLITISQNEYIPPATYTLVTDINQVVSGKHYIIASSADDGPAYAMGAQNSNNRAGVAVTVSEENITQTGGVYEFVINGPNDGKYTIYDKINSGYLYAASSGSNYLKTETELDNDGRWSISVANTGVATIIANGTNTRNNMRYNSSSKIFSCYSSGQSDVYLYVKDDDTELEYYGDPVSLAANAFDFTHNTYSIGGTMTITGAPVANDPSSLIIQDGAQLIHESSINATVQNDVTAAPSWTSNVGGGWYFIASPIDGAEIAESILVEPFDLYKYNEPEAMWYAYNGDGDPFTTMERGIGYLHASADDQILAFAGTMIGTETEITKPLSYECTYGDLIGYNLMGNPYTRVLEYGDMKIGGVNVTSFLSLNDAGTEYVTCNLQDNDRIRPCQGFFIQATGAGQNLVFNPAKKDRSEIGLISIKAGNEEFMDKAYIQIGGGNTLRKIAFSDNNMVYVMDGDDDYAAMTVYELATPIPVHFVAAEPGTYTITVNAKNIDLDYMHLVDEFTNEHIDLLSEPTYTFTSAEGDKPGRFTIVFGIDNVEENLVNDVFVYQYEDELVVDGNGTLQIFDVLGRFVGSHEVHGSERISLSAFNTGVYVLRMVGENVKTQKIVVR